jgi:phage recombination protein Bet
MVKEKKKEEPKEIVPEVEVSVMPKKKAMNAIEEMAYKLKITPDSLKATLKATVFKECKSDAEFIAAVLISNKYGLNPILKEIYAFPAQGGGIIPVVSIDGWVSLAKRHPQYDGVELKENFDANGKCESVTATFYIKGIDHPVVVTEYMSECYNGNKTPWVKWPIRMLRHKAYIQGARIAFGFSGIYDEDEKERIAESIEAETAHLKPIVETPKELPCATQETPVTEGQVKLNV